MSKKKKVAKKAKRTLVRIDGSEAWTKTFNPTSRQEGHDAREAYEFAHAQLDDGASKAEIIKQDGDKLEVIETLVEHWGPNVLYPGNGKPKSFWKADKK